jgi:hypothetical protein
MSRYEKIHLVRTHFNDVGLSAVAESFACLDTKEQLERQLGSGTKEIRSQVVSMIAGLGQMESVVRSLLAECILEILPDAPPDRTLNTALSIDFDHDSAKGKEHMTVVAAGNRVPDDFIDLFAHSLVSRSRGDRAVLLAPGSKLRAACAFVPAPLSRKKQLSGGGTVKVYAGASLPSKGTFEDYIALVNESSAGKFDEFLKYSRAFDQ